MKKVIYTVLLASFFTTSCNSVGPGVKVIGKCCKQLIMAKSKCNCASQHDEELKASDDIKGASLLPLNSWDTKMMIW